MMRATIIMMTLEILLIINNNLPVLSIEPTNLPNIASKKNQSYETLIHVVVNAIFSMPL